MKADVTKRVLIVDDEPVLIGLLREIFVRFRHGHTYEITPRAYRGRRVRLAAAGTLRSHPAGRGRPDAGDPWPWLRGLDLLKRVRLLGVKAPVFMMTGVRNTEKEAEALIEGAAGYLHKPFDLRELNRLVTLTLGGDPAPRRLSGVRAEGDASVAAARRAY